MAQGSGVCVGALGEEEGPQVRGADPQVRAGWGREGFWGSGTCLGRAKKKKKKKASEVGAPGMERGSESRLEGRCVLN